MNLQTPGLYTKEKEISVIQPDRASSNVLSVLTTKNGLAMEEVIINNVDELVEHFGEPTDNNYKEWFQVWNFLQYSSPITVIRIIDTDTSGYSSVGSIRFDYDTNHHDKLFENTNDLYNNNIGRETISDFTFANSLHTLQIFNRYVSNEEKIAIAICSNTTQFNQPFSDEKIYYTTNESPLITYDSTADIPISKTNIFFSTSREKEYYVEGGVDKILNHGFKFDYKLIGSYNYRMAFDPSLQDYENGECITFKQLFNSDITVDFNDGYFLLAIFKYNPETLVFNLLDQYVLNYNVKKKIGDFSYAQIQNLINETNPNIWISINSTLNFENNSTYDRVQTINTNSDTILSNVIRNDYRTKQMNIEYETNTYEMNSSILEIYNMYSDFNYGTNIRYILPIVKINQNDSLNLETASDLALVRKNCLSVMSIWNETDLKAQRTDLAKINIISEYLGTSSRNNTQFTNKNSYTVCYDNIKYQNDIYNIKNRWIPIAGDIVGIIDSFDKSFNAYDVPAGYNTTRFKNVIKMMYELKDVKLKNKLANESINIIIKDDNGEWILFDMLTNISGDLMVKKLNVRRLVLEIKKIIQRTTKSVFFGLNDVVQRSNLVLQINKELSTITGLQDFKVICDTSNNGQDELNSNILNIDLFLQPRNYIRVINLRINLTKNNLNSITEIEI